MEIKLQNYCKTIRGNEVLKDISIAFHSGVCYGLQGKNGSGKTMLMRAVSGLIFPTSGSAVIDGKVLGKEISFPENMGLLIENPAFLPGFTGKQNLQLIADIRSVAGDTEIDSLLREVGLDPQDKRKYRKYSLGMKQRLGVAAAFMEQPDLIILDEPINAIDEKGIEQVHAMIEKAKARNAVLIVACHDKEELYRLADVIVKLENGQVAGTMEVTEEMREKIIGENISNDERTVL